MPNETSPSVLPCTHQVGAGVTVPTDRLFPEGAATVVGVIFRPVAVQYICESPAGRQQTFESGQVAAGGP